MSERTGVIMAITGDGKGKTTAALGMVLRASGHGHRCLILQFMKGTDRYGEVHAVENLLTVTLIQVGRDAFVNKNDPDPADAAKALEGLALAEESIQSGQYDLIVLDELHTALDFNLLPLDRVLAMLEKKPPSLTIVTTGRNMPPALGLLAHTVSEVREVKHHAKQGIPFQEGIEY